MIIADILPLIATFIKFIKKYLQVSEVVEIFIKLVKYPTHFYSFPTLLNHAI